MQFTNMFLDNGRKGVKKFSELAIPGIKYIDRKASNRKLEWSVVKRDESGEPLVTKSEVLLPPWSRAFYQEGEVIDINTIPEDVSSMLPYRMPTDSNHPTPFLDVECFLQRKCDCR